MIQRIQWVIYLHTSGSIVTHRYWSADQLRDYDESPFVKYYTVIDEPDREKAIEKATQILQESKRKI